MRWKEKGINLIMGLTVVFLVMGIETNTAYAGNLALSGAEGLDAACVAGRAVTNLSGSLAEGDLGLVYTAYQQLSMARQSAADAYIFAGYASGSGTSGTYAYYARMYANDALRWAEEAEHYASLGYSYNSVSYCLLALNRIGLFNMYMCTAIYNASQGSNGGRY